MTGSEKKYLKLRNSIDEQSDKLHALHKDHMKCRKGCDHCCMDYEIFPIEFDHIKKSINNKNIELDSSEDGGCIFLKGHECQIYEHRPIICRTHGLPLLFMNDEQWELSTCELNFTDFDDEGFSTENTFLQDQFNSQLFLLNKEFLKERNSSENELGLIPIRQLKD